MPRERLDKLLVDRGLVPSRERARALVMSGVVLVRGHAETKPGTMLDPSVEITLKEADHPYVSRGALKLVKGLDAFGIDPTGLVGVDIGASTGGFTDVLLRRGARKVYAIDVGYGQLAWSLRQDPRVVVLERENVRNMDLGLVPEPCDIAVTDVSFVSLTLVLPRIAQLLRPPTGKPIVALVKPQFEVGRELVGKGGVVRDEAVRRSAVTKIRDWATAHGFECGDDVESPITGPAGNVEYLLLLRTAGAESLADSPARAESTADASSMAGSDSMANALSSAGAESMAAASSMAGSDSMANALSSAGAESMAAASSTAGADSRGEPTSGSSDFAESTPDPDE